MEKRKLTIICIILCALVLAIGLIVFFKQHNNNNDEICASEHLNGINDVDPMRQFPKPSKLGIYSALSADKLIELNDTINAMQSNYDGVRICSYKNLTKCDLKLDPDLIEIMQNSDDAAELQYYWKQWYSLAGTPARQHFNTYLRLVKEAATTSNLSSGAELWLSTYGNSTIEQQLMEIFEKIRPLYAEIHAYVRYKLREEYWSRQLIPENGSIPMHLLNSMWGDKWHSVFNSTVPYPNRKSIVDEIIPQNFTQQKYFQLSEQFFKSIGMDALPKTFWERSTFKKQTDVRMNMDDLRTTFHQLSYMYFFLKEKGANPSFHKAVANTFASYASTPKYLQKIGLLKNYAYDKETKINELYKMALEKIVFLPFAYTLDRYRWAVFRGGITPDDYNCEFWQILEDASGIKPPVQRYKYDFDPTAFHHVSANIEYLPSVVSTILEFNFFKSACIVADNYNSKDSNMLSDCDIYDRTVVGQKFKQKISSGASKPWPNAMEILTGERKLSADALMEYFNPLLEWLKNKNRETGAHVGWENEFKCVST